MSYQQEQQPQGATILIVEDDTILRHPLAEYLRGAGYVIFEAASSVEAIAVFNANIAVDIVFSDIRMAGPMDGLHLARWIRKRHPGVRIALTSGADYRVPDATIAEAFVNKPYHVAEVAALLGALAGQERSPSN